MHERQIFLIHALNISYRYDGDHMYVYTMLLSKILVYTYNACICISIMYLYMHCAHQAVVHSPQAVKQL